MDHFIRRGGVWDLSRTGRPFRFPTSQRHQPATPCAVPWNPPLRKFQKKRASSKKGNYLTSGTGHCCNARLFFQNPLECLRMHSNVRYRSWQEDSSTSHGMAEKSPKGSQGIVAPNPLLTPSFKQRKHWVNNTIRKNPTSRWKKEFPLIPKNYVEGKWRKVQSHHLTTQHCVGDGGSWFSHVG